MAVVLFVLGDAGLDEGFVCDLFVVVLGLVLVDGLVGLPGHVVKDKAVREEDEGLVVVLEPRLLAHQAAQRVEQQIPDRLRVPVLHLVQFELSHDAEVDERELVLVAHVLVVLDADVGGLDVAVHIVAGLQTLDRLQQLVQHVKD